MFPVSQPRNLVTTNLNSIMVDLCPKQSNRITQGLSSCMHLPSIQSEMKRRYCCHQSRPPISSRGVQDQCISKQKKMQNHGVVQRLQIFTHNHRPQPTHPRSTYSSLILSLGLTHRDRLTIIKQICSTKPSARICSSKSPVRI